MNTILQPRPDPRSPLEQAIAALKSRGCDVQPADIPGLWSVSGYPELTTGQVINVGIGKRP
jgi:hypothetical protein